MLITLLEFLQQTSLSAYIAHSRYAAMVFQTIHVLGFTMLLAIVVAYNLRTQSIALRSVSLPRFARSIDRYYNVALLVALGAGFLLGLPRAVAYWGNIAFVYKMALLVPAVVLQSTLRKRVLSTREGTEASPALKAVAALSLLLWFVVGAAGRAIGFVA